MDLWPVMVAAVWIGTGLITGAWMMRRGHDARWFVVALALGPLFVPMALERVERTPRVADSEPDGPPATRLESPGLRVLVGVDGSPAAERALDVALAIVGGDAGQVILAEVVGYDATEPDEPEALRAAELHLERARTRSGTAPVNLEVLAGPPGEALSAYAAEHDVDLIVVGRHGHGVAHALMGGVTEHLVRHGEMPVLVVGPRSDAGAVDATPAP